MTSFARSTSTTPSALSSSIYRHLPLKRPKIVAYSSERLLDKRQQFVSFSKMSWMDSWSRPSKHAVTPPPLYLTIGDAVPYCHTCGRVISERRKTQNATEVKYCSTRCRNNKPGPIDRKIEATFAALLNGATEESLKENAGAEVPARASLDGKKEKEKPIFEGKLEKGERKPKKKAAAKPSKGDHRIILDCSIVEEVVFQRGKDPEKVYGRRKNRKARFVVEKPEDWKSVDMVDKPPAPPNAALSHQHHNHGQSSDEDSYSDSENEHEGGIVLESSRPIDGDELPDIIPYGYGSGKIRPPQAQNDVNGSVGGEKGWAERIEETDEMKLKRREGQRRAEEREKVRQAARRGCAFGFAVEGADEKRKCEAVMKGTVVEASFAKGEWGVRWREEV